MEDRSPALGRPAFICPHCRAFTQQAWFDIRANECSNDPVGYEPDKIKEFISKIDNSDDDSAKTLASYRDFLRIVEGRIPGILNDRTDPYSHEVFNAHFSRCFVCNKESFWISDILIFPRREADVPEPNIDIPAHIRGDYEEAALVLSTSPRSAAALLRLVIQKLCAFLLGKEGDINAMIKELVTEGLSIKVQRALDVVRVIGNEAVHPGTIDLKDDHDTATKLFTLVNIITETMISQPKHVEELYSSLPPSKLKGIEDRDAGSKKS
jgi:hypothetical protein